MELVQIPQAMALSKYKHGVIFKQSEILKIWKKRFAIIDYTKRQLLLRSGAKGIEKAYDLSNYNTVWIGQ